VNDVDLPSDRRNLENLSRAASHALRHEPWLYELELDDEGWTSIDAFMNALRDERPEWKGLIEADLARMIAQSTKQRHEISGGRIRALYGHSLPGKLKKTPAVPPDVLFHGTAARFVVAIRANGLLPMGRQYVHLSVDELMATEVGKRKAERPVILRIAAAEARSSGTQFYEGNDRVWLADSIPPAFLAFDSPH
jgi:putative RNA 2'-phosphotransferase